MFHYSLVPTGNRSRLLTAVFIAAALHIGLMRFDISLKQVFIPEVYMPRSVNVFLKQNYLPESSMQQTGKAKTVEQLIKEKTAAEIQPEETLIREISPIKEKKKVPLQQPTFQKKIIEQPVVEKSLPVSRKQEVNKILSSQKSEVAVETQKTVSREERTAVSKNEKAIQPRLLQMAYPRYQLNNPPPYPQLARKRGQQGTVLLRVLVNEKGTVEDLEIKT